MLRFILLSATLFVLVVIVSGQDPSTRPKNCPLGTTYNKDCNTCTCGAASAAVAADKCSKFDCNKNKGPTTPRAPNPNRPGVCPTKVTPRPGIDDCSKRNQTQECKVDKDCPAAKKCCENGCKVWQCRNAIYANSP